MMHLTLALIWMDTHGLVLVKLMTLFYNYMCSPIPTNIYLTMQGSNLRNNKENNLPYVYVHRSKM